MSFFLILCGIFAVTGRVEEDFGNVTITASKLELIPCIPGIKIKNMYERNEGFQSHEYAPVIDTAF